MERRLFEEEQSGEEVTARLKERTKELEEARYVHRAEFVQFLIGWVSSHALH